MKSLYITSNRDFSSLKKNYEIQKFVDYCDSNNATLTFVNLNNMLIFDEEKFPTAYYNISGYPNEIHFRYLRYLELNGVKSINSIYNERIACDKMLSGLELKYNGIPIADTISLGNIYFTTPENIISTVENHIGFPCVIKAPTLGRGVGVVKCDTKNHFIEILGLIFSTDSNRYGPSYYNNFIVQKFISETVGKCIRTYVLNNKLIGCMTRTNDNYWKVNLNDGGLRTLITDVPEVLINMSLHINQILKLNFSAIDFHITNNGYIFNEINPIPDFEIISNLNSNLHIATEICMTLLG